jgi:hypothetical protein
MNWFEAKHRHKPNIATPGGMCVEETASAAWTSTNCDKHNQNCLTTDSNTSQRDAGWNVERVCREPDIPAAGGCERVGIRRLPGRAPSTMVKINQAEHVKTSL